MSGASPIHEYRHSHRNLEFKGVDAYPANMCIIMVLKTSFDSVNSYCLLNKLVNTSRSCSDSFKKEQKLQMFGCQGLHLWCKVTRYAKEGAHVHETNHLYIALNHFSRICFYIPAGALTQDSERCFTANIKVTSHNNFSIKTHTYIFFTVIKYFAGCILLTMHQTICR